MRRRSVSCYPRGSPWWNSRFLPAVSPPSLLVRSFGGRFVSSRRALSRGGGSSSFTEEEADIARKFLGLPSEAEEEAQKKAEKEDAKKKSPEKPDK